MKIRIYIVTFKRNEILNANLCALWASVPNGALDLVTVLANHPSVEIAAQNLRPNLRLIINTTRALHAWGNLARDWNFAIVDGFRTWRNPDGVDWVILAQNDVVWQSGWFEGLAKRGHLQLVTQPRGDQVVALRIEAVRKIGFFDERFTTLAYQDADYCLRAALHLDHEASINDDHLGQRSEWNPTGAFMIAPTYTGAGGHEEESIHTARFSDELAAVMVRKWRLRGFPETHDFAGVLQRKHVLLRNLPEEINWYPFFWDGCPELPLSLRWQQRVTKRVLRPALNVRARRMGGRVKRKIKGFLAT